MCYLDHPPNVHEAWSCFVVSCPFSIVMLQCSKEAFCCLIITFLMKGLSYQLQEEMVGAI